LSAFLKWFDGKRRFQAKELPKSEPDLAIGLAQAALGGMHTCVTLVLFF
jgi:hypothetical protein